MGISPEFVFSSKWMALKDFLLAITCHFHVLLCQTLQAYFYYQAINIAQADVHTRKKLLIFQYSILVISKQKGRKSKYVYVNIIFLSSAVITRCCHLASEILFA